MPVERLSGVDAVIPAVEHVKKRLFQPFRWSLWWRLSLLGLLTGEFGMGSGGNFNIPSDFPRDGKKDLLQFFAGEADVGRMMSQWLPWIVLAVAVLLVLGLLWIYVSSVFRFVLLDTVLHGRCDLRAGWRRWRERGRSFFWWQIGVTLVMLLVLGVVVGVPLLMGAALGVFQNPKEHLALAILGGMGLFFAIFAVLVLNLLVWLFSKDFVLPIMALEGTGAVEGWRRFTPLLKAEKSAYAVYVLMKIVLAIAAAILFGIINLIVLLVLLIPVGIAGVGVVLAGKAAGLTWTAFTVAAAVTVGVALLLVMFWLFALINTPGMFFFQSYTLHFFGSRYARVGDVLFAVPTQPAVPALTSSPGS